METAQRERERVHGTRIMRRIKRRTVRRGSLAPRASLHQSVIVPNSSSGTVTVEINDGTLLFWLNAPLHPSVYIRRFGLRLARRIDSRRRINHPPDRGLPVPMLFSACTLPIRVAFQFLQNNSRSLPLLTLIMSPSYHLRAHFLLSIHANNWNTVPTNLLLNNAQTAI